MKCERFAVPCENRLRQHNRRLMNSDRTFRTIRVLLLTLAAVYGAVRSEPANAQSVQHLAIIQPGGMPGLPVVTGVARVTNGVSVTWDGPSGYCQLLQKRSLKDPGWQAVGAPNLLGQATITSLSSNAFFRVSGPTPQYAGAATCAECHSEVLNTVVHTAHFGAFTNLAFADQTNRSCLPCHTVGYQLPSGFTGLSATPQLAGVQCENCHGPAANHAANPIDPTAIPRVEVAATLCGGCHNAQFVPASAATNHPPYYEEWNASPHQSVLADLKADFAGSAGSNFFIPTCGRCHSGTVREAFLENTLLPDAQEASAVGIACATCHDPHAEYANTNVLNGVYSFTNLLSGLSFVISNTTLGPIYTNQLRNPLSSTNNYSLIDGPFASQYDTNVNLCAQCHNDRGASWTNWNFPPHNSLQYNMLLGTVGVLTNGALPNLPATHSQLEKQCVACHMQTSPYQSQAQPGIAGHGFKVQLYDTCNPCHGVGQGQGLVGLLNFIVSTKVSQVKSDLDAWAITKAPAALTNYGTRALEYVNPGGLSSGGPGPTSTLQTNIPVNIQKARFDLYSVYNDGSGGVHNPFYVLYLLDNADWWVQGELNKPTP